MKKEINALLEKFDNDNLTNYQKENNGYSQSTQAKVTHAIIGAIDFQIKSQKNYIGNSLVPNLQKAVESSNTTDTHEDYLNSLNLQIGNAELCVSSMEDFTADLKAVYLHNVGEEFRPYTTGDKKLLGKQMMTSSRLEGLAKLKTLGVKVDNPALEQIIKDVQDDTETDYSDCVEVESVFEKKLAK